MMPTEAIVVDTTILYRSGYKYQLAAEYRGHLDIKLQAPINTEWWSIDEDGGFAISAGYAWDGPSGPTIDTRTFMRGSLVHDMLYQAMRIGLLSPAFKDAADAELRQICLADGMHIWRAWYVWRGVQWGGHKAIVGGPRLMRRAPKVTQPIRQLDTPRGGSDD